MNKKVDLLLLFGGQSCEHEVSVTSARSMMSAIDTDRYELSCVGISREGAWILPDDIDQVFSVGQVSSDQGLPVYLDYTAGGRLCSSNDASLRRPVDIVFPVLHGTGGEDGALQGLLELANVAYVGSGVGGSATGMDKELMRKAFYAVGLQQTDWVMVREFEFIENPDRCLDLVSGQLSFPLFVKPASQGSSVGISKAGDRSELVEAIRFALKFDYKVMVETSVEGAQEVECAVLGNDAPRASVVGEIIPGAEFYNYETKYIDDKSQLIIPARLEADVMDLVQRESIRAFQAIEGFGLSRVDFLYHSEKGLFINEINTMPGFTPISMYPKLWQESGLSYAGLIDQLVQLGLDRYQGKSRRTSLRE